MSNDGAVNLGLPSNSGTAVTPFTLSASGLTSAVYFGGITLPALTLSGSLQGPSALPAFTLSGTAVSGAAAEGDAFLPSFSSDGTALDGRSGVGDVRLSGFTLAATTGVRGNAVFPLLSITAKGVTGTVSKGGGKTPAGQTISQTSIRLPPFAMTAGAMRSQLLSAGSAPLAPFTLAATAIVGSSSVGEIALRAPRVSATGLTGDAPAGSVQLPTFTLAATTAQGSASIGSVALPAFTLASGLQPQQPQNLTGVGDLQMAQATLAGTMLPGAVATGAAVLREPTLDAVLANSPPMTGAIQFAEFTLVASGLSSNAAASTIVRVPEFTLAAQAVSGAVGTADITLPLVTLSAHDGVLDVVGTASITLPFFHMSGTMLAATLDSPSFTGIALNTRTKAVTEYMGIAPNSVASFMGVTLMATADGIVALAGASDIGNPISASLTSAKTDLGNPVMKRVLSGYVGLRAGGDMELTLIADDHHEAVYRLEPRQIEGEQHRTRAKFGRGAKGVYWQWKLANVDGAHFAIDHIELHPATIGNKV